MQEYGRVAWWRERSVGSTGVSSTCNVFGHVVASKMLLGLRMRLSTECNASGVTNGVKRETAMRLAVFHSVPHL
jgi:hypothetical protein